MKITWKSKTRRLGYLCWCGYVENTDTSYGFSPRYFVGVHEGQLICDVYDTKSDTWYSLKTPVKTVKECKQICEMREATGAY